MAFWVPPLKAGNNSAAKIPTIAMTTKSSTSVKPLRERQRARLTGSENEKFKKLSFPPTTPERTLPDNTGITRTGEPEREPKRGSPVLVGILLTEIRGGQTLRTQIEHQPQLPSMKTSSFIKLLSRAGLFPEHLPCAALWAVLGFAAIGQSASAAGTMYYWDTSTSANLQAGNGAWDTSTTLWSSATGGSNPLIQWVDGNNASFTPTITTGSTSAVTIGSTVTVGTITNTSTDTTITGGTLKLGSSAQGTSGSIITQTSGSLTIGSAVVLDYSSNSRFNLEPYTAGTSLTINGNITQTTAGSQIRASGSTATSTLTLNGTNSFSGGINIHTFGAAGTQSNLTIGQSAAVGTGRVVFGFVSAGLNETDVLTANFSSNQTVTNNLGFTGDNLTQIGMVAIINSIGAGTATFNGTMSASGTGGANSLGGSNGNLTFKLGGTNTGANTFQTAIVNLGTGNATTVIKQDSGNWVISGANTYTGSTTVSAGTLALGATGALGNGTSNTSGLTVSATGAAFDLNGYTPTANVALTLNGTGVSSGGALVNSSATAAAYAGTVALGSASSIGGAGNITLSNTISGAYGLTKVGANTLILTGATNGSTATTISTGTLQIGSGGTSGALGSGAVANNGTLAFDRSDSYGGTVNNAISGTGAVTVSGGNLTLGGANTYTGSTTVSAGTLALGATGALGNGTSNTSGLTVSATGAAFDLNGYTPTANVALTLNGTGVSSGGALVNSSATAAAYAGTVALGSASSIGGAGNITLSNTISGAYGLTKVGANTLILTGATNGSTATTISTGTLQIGSGGTSGALGSGAVANNGTLAFDRSDSYGGTVNNAISGTGAVTVSGGTLTLGGANTYLGTTTVTSGTLILSGSVTSNVTVQSGGTIGGTGTIAGNLLLSSGSHFEFSLTNTLAVNTGTVSFGAGGFGVANLTGLDSSVATGTYQLISGSINTANLNNLGALNAFSIGGGKSAYFQNASLDLVVVPEPATWALLTFSLTTVMVLRRRRS